MPTVTGFTPHPKQRQIIEQILSSKSKFHVASIGRQFGKSLAAENIVLYWAINHAPVKILWVAPVYSQTTKVHKEIYNAIVNTGIVQSNNYSDNELTLKTGSTIYFRSAERYDNIRSWTYDYAVIDEAAFIKEEAWTEAIRPTLAVRGKKVIFISTPKGKNWFHTLYQLGQSEDYPNYKSYKGSSYDTPFISREELEDARKTLPEDVFRQEYLAEFIDGGGTIFRDIKERYYKSQDWPKPEGKVYCGIDLGKQLDYTCATFMDAKGNVVYVYRDHQKAWSTMVNEIMKHIKRFNATVLVEINSIGDVIFEQIKNQWQDTHPFITIHKSKNEIIEGLILDFNDMNIAIPPEELFGPLSHELEVFTYEYSPKTRSIKYGHPVGMNDDTVISLAIANYHRKQNKNYGRYSIGAVKIQ
jgi:hypothetical protein